MERRTTNNTERLEIKVNSGPRANHNTKWKPKSSEANFICNQQHNAQVIYKWIHNRSEQFFPCKWCELYPKGIENLNKHMKLALRTKEDSSSVEKHNEMSDNWLYNYLDDACV